MGQCWPGIEDQILEWDAKLFGRMERHNPEGKGPNGKVDEGASSNKNHEKNPDQDENYKDPENHIPTDSTFNPYALSIMPRVNEQKMESDDPKEDVIMLEGTIKYFPGVAPPEHNETREEKKKRILAAKDRLREDFNKARERMKDDTSKLFGNVGGFLKNLYTNNRPEKPTPEENNGELKFPTGIQKDQDEPSGEAQIKPKVPSFVSPTSEIPGLDLTMRDVFPEGRPNEAKFASHKTVLPNCNWKGLYDQIEGEYYDKEFPAEASSVVGFGTATTEDDKKKVETMRNYEFKRLSYVLEDVKVVQDGISPNDIFQGQLGDCYYLSALAAVAEHPDRIERIIVQKETSEKGAYCVALNILGQWISVVLDDIFPVNPRGSVPFCYTKTQEIWAMLLEKAYAKVYGGYWNIGCGGITCEALKDITGAPCTYIDLEEEDQRSTALKTIEDADKKHFIITCSSKGSGEHKSEKGIISGHAYTLVSIVHLSDGTELLHLRNPWGRGEWKGDWGDESPLWDTPGAREEAGWKSGEDDGMFYMRFDDFCENFSAVTICHYHNDYILSTLKGDNDDEKLDVRQFTVNKAGSYYIGLSQPDSKQFKPEDEYEMGYLSCTIIKREGTNVKFIDGFASSRRDIWSKMELEEGSYLAIMYTNWNSANTLYSFWAYGPQNVPIKKVYGQSYKDICMNILYDALLQHALQKQEGWKYMSNPDYSAIRYRLEYGGGGYGFYIFDNGVDNVKLTAIIGMEAKNCEIVTPLPGEDGKVELFMEPKESKMLLYRICNLPNSLGFSISFKMRKTFFGI